VSSKNHSMTKSVVARPGSIEGSVAAAEVKAARLAAQQQHQQQLQQLQQAAQGSPRVAPAAGGGGGSGNGSAGSSPMRSMTLPPTALTGPSASASSSSPGVVAIAHQVLSYVPAPTGSGTIVGRESTASLPAAAVAASTEDGLSPTSRVADSGLVAAILQPISDRTLHTQHGGPSPRTPAATHSSSGQ
jgi:hypothetical protein